MMMRAYEIAADNMIDGNKLVHEIEVAHGIYVGDSYGFTPPRTFAVSSQFDNVDLTATVLAHDPQIIEADRQSLWLDEDDATIIWRKRTQTTTPTALLDGAPLVVSFAVENGVGTARVTVGPFDTEGFHPVKISSKTIQLWVHS